MPVPNLLGIMAAAVQLSVSQSSSFFCTRIKGGKVAVASRPRSIALHKCDMRCPTRIPIIRSMAGDKGSKHGSMHKVPSGMRPTKGTGPSSLKATDPALGSAQAGQDEPVTQKVKLPKVGCQLTRRGYRESGFSAMAFCNLLLLCLMAIKVAHNLSCGKDCIADAMMCLHKPWKLLYVEGANFNYGLWLRSTCTSCLSVWKQ